MTRTMSEKIERNRYVAARALEAYRSEPGFDDDDLHTIRDLIEDLLHLYQYTLEGEGHVDGREMTEQMAIAAVNDYTYESDPANADEKV